MASLSRTVLSRSGRLAANNVRPLAAFSRQASIAATSTSPASSQPVPTRESGKLPSLSNIEAAWKSLAPQEQEGIFKELEELQKKDWKELSVDQKKAAYFVSFGPHGPREPILPEGSQVKVAAGVIGLIAVAAGTFFLIRTQAHEKPKTMTREWQEAATERAVEQKMDPYTGPANENYKGKGHVSV